jgi:hypothetical protein
VAFIAHLNYARLALQNTASLRRRLICVYILEPRIMPSIYDEPMTQADWLIGRPLEQTSPSIRVSSELCEHYESLPSSLIRSRRKVGPACSQRGKNLNCLCTWKEWGWGDDIFYHHHFQPTNKLANFSIRFPPELNISLRQTFRMFESKCLSSCLPNWMESNICFLCDNFSNFHYIYSKY